jgi:glycosyltransferase involved in cell wall biosynthesis
VPATPRVALLVHNRFEQDPRVSRHAQAARAAGYRVAVLSVVAPNAETRWGQTSGGIAVFESRVTRRTLLGRLRHALQGARGTGTPTVPRPEMEAGADGDGSGSKPSLGGAARDIAAVGMLLRNNVGVFKQFRGIGAGLVHANDLNVLPAAFLLARYWKAPLLYDSHELWVALDAEWSPFRRRLYGMLERAIIRRVDATVTVNGAIAGELASRYGIARPAVVMNCPDVPAATPTAVDERLAGGKQSTGGAPHVAAEELPTSEDASRAGGPSAGNLPLTGDRPLRVIYQGMLNANRGLIEAIDAVAGVEGVELAIRGPGALRDTLRQHIEALALGERARLLPAVPMYDLVSALDGFAVGLVPYLPVGMNNLLCSPNKLFEYMAAGLAVVCSDLPVLREIVESADCGLLYAPGDREALAAALRTLAGDPALLARLRTNARLAAQSRYNAAHEEGTLLAIYARLIVTSPPRTM